MKVPLETEKRKWWNSNAAVGIVKDTCRSIKRANASIHWRDSLLLRLSPLSLPFLLALRSSTTIFPPRLLSTKLFYYIANFHISYISLHCSLYTTSPLVFVMSIAIRTYLLPYRWNTQLGSTHNRRRLLDFVKEHCAISYVFSRYNVSTACHLRDLSLLSWWCKDTKRVL